LDRPPVRWRAFFVPAKDVSTGGYGIQKSLCSLSKNEIMRLLKIILQETEKLQLKNPQSDRSVRRPVSNLLIPCIVTFGGLGALLRAGKLRRGK